MPNRQGLLDGFVERCLALVARRLNGIVESIDRLDGGSGLGLAVASAIARLTGFEVREQQPIIARPRRVAHRVAHRAAHRVARGHERREPVSRVQFPVASSVVNRLRIARPASPSRN